MFVIRRIADQSIVFPTKRLYFCLLEYDQTRAIINVISPDYIREHGLRFNVVYGKDPENPSLFFEHPEIWIGAEYVSRPSGDLNSVHIKFGIEAPKEIEIVKGEELHPEFHPLTTSFQGDELIVNDERYRLVKKYNPEKRRDVYVAERID